MAEHKEEKQATEWSNIQSAVSTALCQPGSEIPDAVRSLQNETRPTKRFNVYRNNIALSLINVLQETFPVTLAIVGEDFFKTMARDYSLNNLPENPVMIEYGATFPGFIEHFEPAASLPYLKDVAELEWARTKAYHAADCAALSLDHIAAYKEADLPDVSFSLHPSATLIQSGWPVVSIWQVHQKEERETEEEELTALLQKAAEAALVIRRELDVMIHPIAPLTHMFLTELKAGKTFGEAVARTMEKDPSFNIPENLVGLFETGLVTHTHLSQEK